MHMVFEKLKFKGRYPWKIINPNRTREEHNLKGKRVRILAVIDLFTRECLALLVDRSITSEKVVGLLDWLFLAYGPPQHLRIDNGPELVARKVQDWLADKNCRTIYITPGSPWENAFIESFIGKFRKECLDRYLFFNLREMQTIIEDWQVKVLNLRFCTEG